MAPPAPARAVTSTTAAWEGESLNDPADIDDRFPALDMILDAGYGKLTSTAVVDMTGGEPQVTRVGAGPVDGVF